jgi:hypothetical protein
VNLSGKQPRVYLSEMYNPGPFGNAESSLPQLTSNSNSLGSLGPFHNWQPHSSAPSPSDYATPLRTSQSTSRGRKRKQDENIYPAEAATSPACELPRKKRKSPLSIGQKLAIVCNAINKEASYSWSFSEFIFYFFRDKDEHGKPVHREQSHALTVQRFLAGHSRFSPADILACWFDHKDGRLDLKQIDPK